MMNDERADRLGGAGLTGGIMTLREQLLLDLDLALKMLADLPESEWRVGWDEPRIQNWQEVFGKLRGAVVSKKPLKHDYDGVVFVRGLDMDGICGGKIFEAAGRIGEAVWQLCDEE